MTGRHTSQDQDQATRLWLDSLTPGGIYALAAWDSGTIKPVYATYIRPVYGYITSGRGTSFAELSEGERHLGHLRGLFGYLPDHPGNRGSWHAPSRRFLLDRMPPFAGNGTFAIDEEGLHETVAARTQAAQQNRTPDRLRDLSDAWWLFDIGYLSGPEMNSLVGAITGCDKLGVKQSARSLLGKYGVTPGPGRCPRATCDHFLEDGVCPIHLDYDNEGEDWAVGLSTRFTIIESPFAAPTAEEQERNVRYVRAAMRECLTGRGEIPIASHATYTLPGVLRDDDPKERGMGMAAGFALTQALAAWVKTQEMACEMLGEEWRGRVVVAVYDDFGVSPGMKAGMAHAVKLGLGVEWRRLSPKELAGVILADGKED